MGIKVQNFGGLIPRISERLLPDNMAVVATDAKMYSGELRAWREPERIADLVNDACTAYKLDLNGSDVWMSWDEDVDVVRAPIANDTYERYYWTSESNQPKLNTAVRIAAGNTPYNLGVPPGDDSKITATPDGSGSGDTETRFYAYSFETAFGEEGAVGITDPTAGASDDVWTITTPTVVPTGYLNNNVAFKNIYRTVSGQTQTDFFFIAKVPLSQGTFVDDPALYPSSEVALNDTLESTSWLPPPTDLRGLMLHPNGFLVGFTGRDVYMSEPYRPHAWPEEYVITVDYPVVGLGLVGTSIVILTEVFSYNMTGIRPESMTLVESNRPEPCVSKRSITNFYNRVLFQANHGIVATDGVSFDTLTEPLMTITDWQRDYGLRGRLNAASYEDRYIAYFEGTKTGFLLDFTSSQRALTDLTALDTIKDVYVDYLSGDTYIIRNDRALKFDPADGLPGTYTWRSKEFDIPEPKNFGAAQIKFDIPSELTGDDTTQTLYDQILAANQALIDAGPLNPLNLALVNGTGNTHSVPDANSSTRTPFGGSGVIPIQKLLATIPSLTFKMYSRDTLYQKTLMFTHQVPDQMVFRLPSGYKSDVWQFELSGNVNVLSLAVGETGLELKRG